MTTTDPPAFTESSDEISEWRAPPLPPQRALSDRAVRNLAVLTVCLCVLATALTVVWLAQTESNRADTKVAHATAVGTASRAAELQHELDRLSADVAALRQQKDDAKTVFLGSIDQRDRFRDQLVLTEIHLSSLQSQIDGTYATVLTQGDTMALLDDCLRGVSRVLNLAAIHSDEAAVAELFAHYGSCVRANEILEGAA